MLVRLKKSQLDNFRRKARNSPNEQIAYLVGRKCRGNCVEVAAFVYPLLDVSTPVYVEVNQASLKELYGAAHDAGLIVVGSIHSHPNCLPVMSEFDLKGHIAYGDHVSGIVEVTNRKTRVAFWTQHSPLMCDLEYV